MESKDFIRNVNPDELLRTQHEQFEKDGEANDKELDFNHIIADDSALSVDAIGNPNAIDASDLTDPRELDASILAEDENDFGSDELKPDGIENADWGKIDPQSIPGGSRSGMDPAGPSSGVL